MVAAKLPYSFPELAKHGLVFLSHRREILYQAYRTFKELFKGEKWIGIDMGEREATGFEDFLFISIDSLGRLQSDRILKYKRKHPGIIIVDEAHHAEAEGIWDNVLNYFGVGSDTSQHYRLPGGNLKPLLVFLTATPRPERSIAFIDAVAAEYGIKYAIREGWACDIKSYRESPRYSDYKDWDADMQVDFLIKGWMDYVQGMRTLVFAKNVAQSKLLASTFNEHNIAVAGHIDAKTNEDERKLLVKGFGLPHGHPDEVQVMTNRLIFTEGYDNRYIQCILDNAPTKAQRTYIQKVGRGLRPAPDADIYSFETAAERREAIRKSSKPYLTYLTTFPLEHSLDMAASVFGVGKEVKSKGALLVNEIIDIIENEEADMPEAPFREAQGISSIDVSLKRVDVWTQTVYNTELITISPLRWISDTNWCAILLPVNLVSSKKYEQTPTILFWRKDGEKVTGQTVTIGGWNEDMGHPVKPTVNPLRGEYATLSEAIAATDKAIKRNPSVAKELHRADSSPASEQIKNYLRRNKVRFNDNKLTTETAILLSDDFKIRKKLTELQLL